MRKRHVLKIWPRFYDAVDLGLKTFEVRKNDRDFHEGDLVLLREWDPEPRLNNPSDPAEGPRGFTDKPELGPYVIGYVLPLGGANYGYVAFSLIPVDALGMALLELEHPRGPAEEFAHVMGVDRAAPGGDKTAIVHGMADGRGGITIDRIEFEEPRP